MHTPSAATARVATVADVPTLVALMQEFYAEADYPLAADAAARTFRALIDAPELGCVWLLHDGDRAQGFVVLTVCFSMEYGGLRGFVDDLFVRAEVRNRGLASAGLTALREEAIARGVRALLVEAGADNAAAQRVYARHGFRDAGRQLLSCPLGSPVHVS